MEPRRQQEGLEDRGGATTACLSQKLLTDARESMHYGSRETQHISST